MSIDFSECGLWLVWSLVSVVYSKCGLQLLWSLVIVVFSKCGLWLMEFLVNVVFSESVFTECGDCVLKLVTFHHQCLLSVISSMCTIALQIASA